MTIVSIKVMLKDYKTTITGDKIPDFEAPPEWQGWVTFKGNNKTIHVRASEIVTIEVMPE